MRPKKPELSKCKLKNLLAFLLKINPFPPLKKWIARTKKRLIQALFRRFGDYLSRFIKSKTATKLASKAINKKNVQIIEEVLNGNRSKRGTD